MDLFKKNLAPIATDAWEEIEERADEVIKATLSARKVLFVNGPLGLQKHAVSTGKLDIINTKKDVTAGLYQVKPLLETRIKFALSRWELDNVLRGATDVELSPLEDAVKEIALYEEETIYNGNKEANIQGLTQLAATSFEVNNDASAILEAIASGVLTLQDAFAKGGYNLVVGDDFYKALAKPHGAKLLLNIVEDLIGGSVVRSKVLKGALLLPYNHPDLELTIGQDYEIGYDMHDKQEVHFFAMNAFTLRVLDENLIVKYNLK
ncbi:MAG: family 1 encapsulin nanocompartment shell protein [Candidatus Izemoplasmataceae bacterium]